MNINTSGQQIAQRIKSVCRIKGIPVNKLLNDCSLSKGLIYELEKRNISPSCDKILKISEYLNVSVDFLLGRNGGMIMFIEENMLIRAICDDRTAYTGKVYKIVIQICENDKNRPHALLFVSQDKRYIEQEGEFECVSLWVDKLKSIDVI